MRGGRGSAWKLEGSDIGFEWRRMKVGLDMDLIVGKRKMMEMGEGGTGATSKDRKDRV